MRSMSLIRKDSPKTRNCLIGSLRLRAYALNLRVNVYVSSVSLRRSQGTNTYYKNLSDNLLNYKVIKSSKLASVGSHAVISYGHN